MKNLRILGSSIDRQTFFKVSTRLKSTLVMPLSQIPRSQLQEDTEVVDLFRSVRCKYDFLLKKYLVLGKRKVECGQHIESLADFDQVIQLAIGDDISNLSEEEKFILSEAYACKAKILSLGSSEDIAMALVHIDNALKLDPNQRLAIECQQSILSENVTPVEAVCEEESAVKWRT